MRNRSSLRINLGYSSQLTICLLLIVAPLFLYLITCVLQAIFQETDSTAFKILSKRVGHLATRPTQFVSIRGEQYQLVVDATDQEDFVEDSQGELPMDIRQTNYSAVYVNNSSDNFLTSYDEMEVTNEAERDETIDYNLNWLEKQESTQKKFCRFDRKPVQDLVLLKTHRTGASSLVNIIYRYGDLNNLEFALPKQESYDFYWPLHFNPTFVDRRFINSSQPNALINARYSRGVMERFMPKTAFFLAVLRNPKTYFESVFNSLQLDVILGMKNSTSLFEDFLSQPQEILQRHFQQNKRFNIALNMARNGQAFDLGLLHKYYGDDKMIQKFIEDLTERIDFVLIAEYFDESLVMLKRELCWDLDDIVYFRFHQRGQEYKERNVTEMMNLQIIKWNKADWELYQHFNRTLWERISKESSNFQDEVKELRQKIWTLEKQCISSMQVSENTGELETILSSEIPAYNRYLCRKMTMSEKEYIAYLKEKNIIKVKEKGSNLMNSNLARST